MEATTKNLKADQQRPVNLFSFPRSSSGGASSTGKPIRDIIVRFYKPEQTLDATTPGHHKGVSIDLQQDTNCMCLIQYPEVESYGAHMAYIFKREDVAEVRPKGMNCNEEAEVYISLGSDVEPVFVDGAGLPEATRSQRVTAVRVWCTIPFEVLPAATTLHVTLPDRGVGSAADILDFLKPHNGKYMGGSTSNSAKSDNHTLEILEITKMRLEDNPEADVHECTSQPDAFVIEHAQVIGSPTEEFCDKGQPSDSMDPGLAGTMTNSLLGVSDASPSTLSISFTDADLEFLAIRGSIGSSYPNTSLERCTEAKSTVWYDYTTSQPVGGPALHDRDLGGSMYHRENRGGRRTTRGSRGSRGGGGKRSYYGAHSKGANPSQTVIYDRPTARRGNQSPQNSYGGRPDDPAAAQPQWTEPNKRAHRVKSHGIHASTNVEPEVQQARLSKNAFWESKANECRWRQTTGLANRGNTGQIEPIAITKTPDSHSSGGINRISSPHYPQNQEIHRTDGYLGNITSNNKVEDSAGAEQKTHDTFPSQTNSPRSSDRRQIGKLRRGGALFDQSCNSHSECY